MEHESFESQEIADFLNEHFVCIKVDREERPDLDQIYMNAVQLLTGQGGWPMSVFLTPELMPFFGGTYWPPTAMRGMPGFDQVLKAVIDAWQNKRDMMEQSFDPQHGGFGSAPKFPHTMNVDLLLRQFVDTQEEKLLTMVTTTLDKMAMGGIYDHLGGGFARYSVDTYWLVPHFEKMLYDNALLVSNYVDAYRLTGDANYAREEGKFYVWTPHEVDELLGDTMVAERFRRVYDITESGNFEGNNIPRLKKPFAEYARDFQTTEDELRDEMNKAREVLFNARCRRIRPGKDDKILASWNGLMIEAFAKAGAAFAEPRYIEAAKQ
ncbi:unnamed protein product, partial [Symbiodinium sp. CCMP2456]